MNSIDCKKLVNVARSMVYDVVLDKLTYEEALERLARDENLNESEQKVVTTMAGNLHRLLAAGFPPAVVEERGYPFIRECPTADVQLAVFYGGLSAEKVAEVTVVDDDFNTPSCLDQPSDSLDKLLDSELVHHDTVLRTEWLTRAQRSMPM